MVDYNQMTMFSRGILFFFFLLSLGLRTESDFNVKKFVLVDIRLVVREHSVLAMEMWHVTTLYKRGLEIVNEESNDLLMRLVLYTRSVATDLRKNTELAGP